MKQVYPLLLTPVKDFGYGVFIPDLDIHTQGHSLTEAVEMARDAIGIWAILNFFI